MVATPTINWLQKNATKKLQHIKNSIAVSARQVATPEIGRLQLL
jgi:hypothetical protein